MPAVLLPNYAVTIERVCLFDLKLYLIEFGLLQHHLPIRKVLIEK